MSGITALSRAALWQLNGYIGLARQPRAAPAREDIARTDRMLQGKLRHFNMVCGRIGHAVRQFTTRQIIADCIILRCPVGIDDHILAGRNCINGNLISAVFLCIPAVKIIMLPCRFGKIFHGLPAIHIALLCFHAAAVCVKGHHIGNKSRLPIQ